MYETTDALFTGICDAIRDKDGTTALISHQDIPARIAAISGGGSGGTAFVSPFYTLRGEGMKLENMVASNFSADSAIFLSEALLPANAVWEIGVKFTIPEKELSHSSVIFGSYYGFYSCPSFEIGKDKQSIWAGISSNGNNWDHAGSYSYNFISGADYWVKYIYNGEKYALQLSADGVNFEDVIQIEYSGIIYQDAIKSKPQFGGINRSSNHYFEGSIDLKETYIKIGDEVWWGRGVEA